MSDYSAIMLECNHFLSKDGSAWERRFVAGKVRIGRRTRRREMDVDLHSDPPPRSIALEDVYRGRFLV
jgi:hypothetical protein